MGLFGKKVAPEAQDRVRQYLRDTSALLARHDRAAEEWDGRLQRAQDAMPEPALLTSSPTGPELLPRARELIPVADGFVDDASLVAVPDEALTASWNPSSSSVIVRSKMAACTRGDEASLWPWTDARCGVGTT